MLLLIYSTLIFSYYNIYLLLPYTKAWVLGHRAFIMRRFCASGEFVIRTQREFADNSMFFRVNQFRIERNFEKDEKYEHNKISVKK